MRRPCCFPGTALGLLAVCVMSFASSPAESAPQPANLQVPAICEAMGGPVRQVDYLGFFATEAAAVDVAASIDERIFRVEARPAAVGDRWVVWAKYQQLPTAADVDRHRPAMEALGVRHGGHLGPSCAVGTTPG